MQIFSCFDSFGVFLFWLLWITFSMGVVTTIPIATVKVQYIIESVEGMLKQAQDEGGNIIAS